MAADLGDDDEYGQPAASPPRRDSSTRDFERNGLRETDATNRISNRPSNNQSRDFDQTAPTRRRSQVPLPSADEDDPFATGNPIRSNRQPR